LIVSKAFVSNRRADILAVRNDGKIDLFEVSSRTDDPKILERRMEEVLDKLPEDRRGQPKIISIDRYKYP
jgi:hypothetical protein